MVSFRVERDSITKL